jgi:hypothetical protein
LEYGIGFLVHKVETLHTNNVVYWCHSKVYTKTHVLTIEYMDYTIEHKKRPQHMVLEIQVLACDRHNKKCGRVKPVNGILPSSI